jgi:Tol biopolymer transport system component
MSPFRSRPCLAVALLLLHRPVHADGWKGSQLTGHTSHVRTTVYSPDGKWLLSGGVDNRLLLWDLATGKPARAFAAAQNWVIGAAFSPDGKKVVSVDYHNQALHLFDTKTGKEERRFAGHTGPVHGVAFSPDARRLASAASDGTVRLWDVATGRVVRVLKGHTADVASVRFSPDGRRLVSAAVDQTVRIWDADTGRERARLTGHRGVVIWAEFSPDGRAIASASHDRTVRLWEAATGKERLACTGHQGWVRAVAFAPNGRALASVGQGRVVRVWDVLTGRELCQFDKHTGMVWCVDWSPDGKRLVSGGDDNLIRFHDLGHARMAGKPASSDLNRRQLERLWADLAGADAAKSYRAMRTLVSGPKHSVAFLAEKVAQVGPRIDPKRVARLIADLDADEFRVREKASAGLAALGSAVEADLQQELARSRSPEARARLRALLRRLAGLSAADVLVVRAVETLERIGPASARGALEQLARAARNPRLRSEAAATLQRFRTRAEASK